MHNVQKNIRVGQGVKKARKNKICLNCLKPKSKSLNTVRRAQPEYVNAQQRACSYAYDLNSFLKLLKEEENLISRAREFHKKGQAHENGQKQSVRELCSGG